MDLVNFSLKEWFGLVVIIYFLSIIFKNSKMSISLNKKKLFRTTSIGVFLSFLFLTFLAANRSGIGDTENYINIFLRTPTNLMEFISTLDFNDEWGFNVINYLFRLVFRENYNLYLFSISAIIIGINFCFVYKHVENIELCLVLYIMSGFYVTGLNGMRQSLVASLFLLLLPLIKNKKYIKYIIFCLMLMTIHKSAIVLLPLIFILDKKPWGKYTYGLLILGVSLYIFYPFFSSFLNEILTDSTYEGYTVGILTGSAGSANFIRVLVKIVPLLIAYFFRKTLCNDEYFSIFLHASLFDFIFMLLASVKSWIFARFCIYFNLLSIVLLCIGINKSKQNRKLLYILCLFFYFLFYYYELITTVIS